MREIKFKGQDIEGRWHYGNLAIPKQRVNSLIDAGCYISNSVGMPFAYRVRPETISQYTGLKDKKDKEIYEGDIVVAVNIDDTFTGVVVFDLEELDFKVTNGKENYRNNFSYLCTCEEIEIIGNIHEEPELLEVGE